MLTGDTLAEAIRGAIEITVDASGAVRPVRLPHWTQHQWADRAIGDLAATAAGVALEVETSGDLLTLVLEARRLAGPHGDGTTAGRLAVEVDGALVDHVDVPAGTHELTIAVPRPAAGHNTPPGAGPVRHVRLWLPHTAAIALHRLSSTGMLTARPGTRPRWVHYGSSNSHATDIADPAGAWPVQVARRLNLALTSLAFAGNAMLDPFVARVIAETPADLITLKVGINPVNGDTFRRRTFIPALHGFLDTVRSGHADTPIAVITALTCPIHEHTPGPVRAAADGFAAASDDRVLPGDGRLTLARSRAWVRTVVEARSSDPALHLIDGLQLLGPGDADTLFDRLHPDQEGHDRIAARATPLHARLAERPA